MKRVESSPQAGTEQSGISSDEERGPRDRAIRARFDGGNYRQLAAQYRLSVRQIRKIINGTRT